MAKKSPPAEKDLSPLPVTTAHTMVGSSRVDLSASIISSSVCSRKALSTRSRLIVIHATWSLTSYRMSRYFEAGTGSVRAAGFLLLAGMASSAESIDGGGAESRFYQR